MKKLLAEIKKKENRLPIIIGLIGGIILFPKELYIIVNPIEKDSLYFWRSIDPSWSIALNYANIKNLTWGKDFAFTYGPLSYLVTRIAWGVNKYFFLIFDIFYFFNLFYIFSYSYKKAKMKLLFLLLFLSSLFLFPVFAGGAMALVLFFLMIFWIRINLTHQKSFHYCMQIILLALLFYIKFNTGLISFVLFYSSIIYLFISKKETLTRLIILLFSPILLILLLSLLLNVSLVGYVSSGINLVSGYNEIMYFNDNSFAQTILFARISILVALIFLFSKLFLEKKEILKGLLIVFIFFTGIFVLYKQSFVRADSAHITDFFMYMLFLVLCIQDFNKSSIKDFRNILVLALIGLTFYFNSNKISFKSISEKVNKTKYLKGFAGYTPISGMYLFPNNNSLPQDVLKQIGTNPVDVFPWNIQLLIENNLNYAPRPVIQTYSVYTKYLEDLNFNFYNSDKAPQFILYDYASFDNRYPFYDESKVNLLLTKNYRIINSFFHNERSMLLLEKIPNKNPIDLVFEREFKAKFDEPITMRPNSYYEVLIDNSIKGKFYSIIKNSPEISIFIVANHAVKDFRTSKALLESGFSTGKFVNSIDDFKGILTNRNTNEIQSFFLRAQEISLFINEIIIKEYKIKQ